MMKKATKTILKKILPQVAVDLYRRQEAEAALSDYAKRIRATNRNGLGSHDCGPARAVEVATRWLCRAQDYATPRDGGVARHFSLNTGWSPAYPETTGYIVPTVIRLAELNSDENLRSRAREMLDWLVEIQLPEGAYQAGIIGHAPVPVTFNTGQILLGLSAGARGLDTPAYLEAMHRAANWLRDTQDDDGCWRKYATPFAAPGEKTYETHVAWALLEAERVSPGNGYGASGLSQIRWALSKLQPNGWLADCCLVNPQQPLTHTLGYALRGILEGYRYTEDAELLVAAEQIGNGLAGCIDADGRLAGRLDCNWNNAVDWVCLTGSVQIAANFLDLYGWTTDDKWRTLALRLNAYVRRTLVTEGDPDVIGGVAGAFPIDGEYGSYEYLNWAAKFMIDSNLQELQLASA